MWYFLNFLLHNTNTPDQNPKSLPVEILQKFHFSNFLDWASRLEHSLIQNKFKKMFFTFSLSWLQLSTHWLSRLKPLVHSYMPSNTGGGGSHTTGMQLPCSQIPPSRHCIFRNLLIKHKTKELIRISQGGHERRLILSNMG